MPCKSHYYKLTAVQYYLFEDKPQDRKGKLINYDFNYKIFLVLINN